MVEESLNNFLADTAFPYTVGGTDYAQLDDIDRLEAPTASLTLSGTYATPADYIAALNADGT